MQTTPSRTPPRSTCWRAWFWLPFASSALLGYACSTGAAVVDPVGAYALQRIGGKPLPCTVAHEGSPMVLSGTFLIRANGTCTSRITLSVPQGPQDVAIERTASYTIAGAGLTMSWEGFGVTTGTVEGNEFRMENEGVLYEYRKDPR